MFNLNVETSETKYEINEFNRNMLQKYPVTNVGEILAYII